MMRAAAGAHQVGGLLRAALPLGGLELGIESGDLLLRIILGDAVALLHLADELLALALHHRPVIVGELAPFLLRLAGNLLPVAGDLIPVHASLPFPRCTLPMKRSARGAGSPVWAPERAS